MWQSYIYGMHWKHDGTMYYDEVPAESKEAAKHLRAILTVEYQDSPEARKLLSGT